MFIYHYLGIVTANYRVNNLSTNVSQYIHVSPVPRGGSLEFKYEKYVLIVIKTFCII